MSTTQLDGSVGQWGKVYDQLLRGQPSWLAGAYGHWVYNNPVVYHIRELGGSRLLEVGSGPGFTTALLALHGLEVTAIDADPTMAQRTRDLLSQCGLHGTVHHADGFTFHDPGAYDIVLSSGLVEHFPRWQAADLLSQMSRNSRRYLVTVVPTPYGTANDPPHLKEIALRAMTPRELRRIHKFAELPRPYIFGYGNPTSRWLRAVLPGGLWYALGQWGYQRCTLVATSEVTRGVSP